MRRPRGADAHRFSFRLFAAIAAIFFVVFGAEMAIDLAAAAARTGRPLAEIWPEIRGSWYSAVQAGGCLARAGYCMLSMCVSLFVLAIPFAANFYTAKLIDVYLRDRVNQAVFGLGILASAETHFQTTVVWTHLRGLTPAEWAGFVPAISLWIGVALIAMAWAVLLPYALYAIRYLGPDVLIARLEAEIKRGILRAARRNADHARVAASVRQGIQDLANVVHRAIDRADRDLTLDGVWALGRAYAFYLDRKPALPMTWFNPRREWFAGLSDEAFRLVTEHRTWVGHLLLQHMWLAYFAALTRAPDAVGEIASVALAIAAEAAQRRDEALLGLGLRMSNTMLREALKRGDPGIVQDVARTQREMLARVAASGGERAADLLIDAVGQLAYYHAFARASGAHDCADVVALSAARTVEMTAETLPRALAGVVLAFERIEDPSPPASPHAVLKARALVEACLREAGRAHDADRVAARIAGASAAERAAVRRAVAAAETRSEAGREAFGCEPGLEFIPEPRRSAVLAALDPP